MDRLLKTHKGSPYSSLDQCYLLLWSTWVFLPFFNHVQLRRATFMWKVHHGYTHPPVCNIFTKNPYNLNFILPHAKNEREKNTFEYKCVKAWQAVPYDYKKITTLGGFTTKLKEHLLNSIWASPSFPSYHSRNIR